MLIFPVATAVAQDSADEPATAAEALLDRFVANVTSLTADFTQETRDVDQELIETASGRFALLRPARFVWHYELPFEQLVVADGESLWMYDVELEQVTRADLAEASAGTPAVLLSSEGAVTDDFSVESSYEVDGIELVTLLPRDPQADFSRVLVGFRDDVPAVLEILDGLNQTTRVEFSAIRVNVDVDAGQFRFEPPSHVHVIGAETQR